MNKTDLQIQRDVLAELAWEPSVDASRIGAGVRDGIVRLAGQVSSYAERWEAEHAADRIGGVKALVVDIEVRLPDDNVRTDADLARSAQNVIEWITYLPAGSVCVLVQDGWLTLAGQVDWPYQRLGAEAGVASLMGVTGLSNRIGLRSREHLDGIRDDDDEAVLRRRAGGRPVRGMLRSAAPQTPSSSICSEMS